MRNDRLATAIEEAGLTHEQLAEALEVDPKTVWRWVNKGVRPTKHNHKTRLAELLHLGPGDLWPGSLTLTPPPLAEPTTDEVETAWAHRADAPKDSWWALLAGAERQIDLLGYAMLFLPEENASLDRLLSRKAESGCRVRIAVVDPDSPRVEERDDEERLGGTMRSRVLTTLDHFRPLFAVDGIELRYHDTPMYASVFRGDDRMLVTPHLYRLKGYKAPLLQLRRDREDGIFSGYVEHFERVWADSRPIPGPPS